MYHICHLITMHWIEKLNNASKMLCYLTTQYVPYIYCVRFICLSCVPRKIYQVTKCRILFQFNEVEGGARYLKFKMVYTMSQKSKIKMVCSSIFKELIESLDICRLLIANLLFTRFTWTTPGTLLVFLQKVILYKQNIFWAPYISTHAIQILV